MAPSDLRIRAVLAPAMLALVAEAQWAFAQHVKLFDELADAGA